MLVIPSLAFAMMFAGFWASVVCLLNGIRAIFAKRKTGHPFIVYCLASAMCAAIGVALACYFVYF